MNTHNKTNKTALITFASILFFLGFFALAQAKDAMAQEQDPGRYAFIEEATGKVTNVILLDPSSNWSAPAGYMVILSDKAEHGDIWDGHEFKRAPKEEPEPESSSIKTDGNDIAELMQAESSILPGDLVAISESGLILRKTNKPYDKNIIGVIAIKPGIVLGRAENGMSLPVVLTGRVPLKVSTENGPIEPGDAITSSSTPGVGMKATKPGRVVGIALEAWSESLFNGSVMILINPHWQGNDLSVQESANGQLVNLDPEQLRTGLASLGLVVNPNGTLTLDTLKARKVVFEKLELRDQITGQVYCTWIENGEWKKIQSDCDSFTLSPVEGFQLDPIVVGSDPTTPSPEPAPAPEPIIEDQEPAPAPPVDEVEAEPAQEPSLAPEPVPEPAPSPIPEPVAEAPIPSLETP